MSTLFLENIYILEIKKYFLKYFWRNIFFQMK